MKNIIVFGAAGRTGRHIVQQAIEAGHKVTGFEHRHVDILNHPNFNMLKGDVHDKDAVFAAVKGHDVVISVIGTSEIQGPAVNLMSDGMKMFVAAMQEYGIKRVLAVGGLAVLQLNEQMQMLDKPDYPAEYKNVGEGHNKVYKVLRTTALDWTFVCCPNIIEGGGNRKYNVKKDYPAEGEFQIYTGDLAHFILTEMEQNRFTQTRVGIANTEK